MEWNFFGEFHHAFLELVRENFAGRAHTRGSHWPRPRRHHSQRQKESGLVLRRWTFAHWETATLQARHRDVAGTFPEGRHSGVRQWFLLSVAYRPEISSLPTDSRAHWQALQCAGAHARALWAKAARKDHECAPGKGCRARIIVDSHDQPTATRGLGCLMMLIAGMRLNVHRSHYGYGDTEL